MPKLIEANYIRSILEASAGMLRKRGADDKERLIRDIIKLIDKAPAINVVRCKECIFNYGLNSPEGFAPEDIVCSYWSSDGLTENDFCSRGERMDKKCG